MLNSGLMVSAVVLVWHVFWEWCFGLPGFVGNYFCLYVFRICRKWMCFMIGVFSCCWRSCITNIIPGSIFQENADMVEFSVLKSLGTYWFEISNLRLCDLILIFPPDVHRLTGHFNLEFSLKIWYVFKTAMQMVRGTEGLKNWRINISK